jgi:DNA invertase Pin-like site-specific DNA recombinase
VSESKLFGYARVSTVQQDLALQVEAIMKYGVLADDVYTDKLSGKEMDNRTSLQELLSKVKEGDTIVVHKLDRLGRSVAQVMSLVDELNKKGIYLVVIDAGIDTRNDEGMAGMMTKALMTLLSLMAEMERTFILERTKPAIAQAKARGVKFGRPKAAKDLYLMAVKEYEEANGTLTVNQVLKKYGTVNGKDVLTPATFYRHLKAYREREGQN